MKAIQSQRRQDSDQSCCELGGAPLLVDTVFAAALLTKLNERPGTSGFLRRCAVQVEIRRR